VRATRHESLLLLQSYMVVEVLTVLTLAAAIAERHRAVHARDQFISIASHELKTPLTSLRLRMTLLLRQLSRAALPQTERDHLTQGLARADLQVDRLTRLVGELLDVSRLHSGRLGLTIENVTLPDIVRDVVKRLAEELAGAGCPVEIAMEAAVAGRWDRARLEQVLTNLLTNAIKYAPGRPIKIVASVREEWTTLAVTDQGPGIARDLQHRIFEPFERGASPGDVEGLGLGLFIVNQIVREHGGTISVDSAPGNGATFRILLPNGDPLAAASAGQLVRPDPT
jgi:signal transduction histidine kinase